MLAWRVIGTLCIFLTPMSHIKTPSYHPYNVPVQGEGSALDPGFLRVAAEFNVVAAASV